MAPDKSSTRRSNSRKLNWLFGVLVSLAVLWSLGWLIGAKLLQNRAADGVETSAANFNCHQPALAGYPLRLGVTCARASLIHKATGIRIDVAGARAHALIYDPGRIIAVITGPMTANTFTGSEVTATWEKLQSSADIDLIARFLTGAKLVVEMLQATTGSTHGARGTTLTARNLEAHIQAAPGREMALNVIARANSLKFVRPDLPKFDAEVIVEIPGAGTVLSMAAPAAAFREVLARAVRLNIERAMIRDDNVSLDFAGTMTISRDGVIDGTLNLTVGNGERLGDALRPWFGQDSRLPDTLQGAVMAMRGPTRAGDGTHQRQVNISINAGLVFIGLIPIGQLPAIGRR